VIVTVLDITERKEADEALMNLSGQLIQAREDECARIARELHDDVSQNVALISLGLDQLSQRPPKSVAELREIAREIFEQTNELSAEIHRMSHDLHPSKVDQLGLVTALKSLCAELSRGYDVSIEFKHSDVPATVPKGISICLYRVVQESLNNVIKYSGAGKACVEVRRSGQDMRLRIEDWGSGFDVEAATNKKGLGLISMRERLRLVGGTLSIDSQISRGTRIDVTVPLAKNGSAQEREQEYKTDLATVGD
jgi:signal transduction histidine kinase